MVDEQPAAPVWRALLCLLLCDSGRLDEGRTQFGLLASHDFSDLPNDYMWICGVTILGWVAVALEDAPRGELLYGLLAPYAGRNTWTQACAAWPVDLTLGGLAALSGKTGRAEQH